MGLHNSVCCSIYCKLSKKQELSETPNIWENKEKTDQSTAGGQSKSQNGFYKGKETGKLGLWFQ